MQYPLIFALVTLATFTLPATAQKGKSKGGLRKQSETQGNYRVTVVEIPENVNSGFVRLKPKVLLYRPIETSKKKLPLIVTLHGSGGGRRDIEQKKWQGAINQLLKTENPEFEAVVVEPQSDGEWDPQSLQRMLDHILSENPVIDTSRLYCMGYSMGGKGTWEWAMNYPDRFAAIIPKGFIPDLSKINSMVDLPIWAMVGDKDSKPRVEGIPAMEKALKELGSNKVKISVFEGANHATAAGRSREEAGVWEWLFSWAKE
jgi:predicted peptidase